MSPAMSNGAIFVQDEVLLVMRQFPIVKDIVYRIETADDLLIAESKNISLATMFR